MIYRFRRINQLLDEHQELMNQEIYFSPPSQLNDAMEGFRDVIWQGDAIVWRNMLKHYLRGLEHVFGLHIVFNEDQPLTIDHILQPGFSYVTLTEGSLKLTAEIESAFFAKQEVAILPYQLASRTTPIRREELLSYFRALHLVALDVISDIYHRQLLVTEKYNFINQELIERLLLNIGTEIEQLNSLKSTNPDISDVSDSLFMVTGLMSQQLDLIQSYNMDSIGTPRNRLFVLSEFPGLFIQKLETCIFPGWYSASFLGDYKNSALWGYYGDHKGVCMEFNTKASNESIALDLSEAAYSSGEQEWSNWLTLKFHKIEYDRKFPEIDFFRSIGGMSVAQLNSQWYMDENGKQSICAEHLNENKQDAWRTNYWSNFYKGTTVKLEEWQYENEYRLIIANGLRDYSKLETRKLKYRFEDLSGIIFGIKTSREEKIKIIKVIEQKCKKNNRKNFQFSQAYYSRKTGTIEKYPMNLLKFS